MPELKKLADETTQPQQTILIIDDQAENIELITHQLPAYRIRAAIDARKGLRIAASKPRPDLILLDIMMPGMNGYEVIRELKANPQTRDIPVIFCTTLKDVTDENQGFSLGAVDYIVKPFNPHIVRARVKTHLALQDQNRQLRLRVEEKTKLLSITQSAIIQRLGRAAEYRDNETGLHVIRMSYYARLVAEGAGMPHDWCDTFFSAAPMHDIGKIGIPDRILLKPGKFEPQEWNIMKQHPVIGAEIIGDHESELLRMARTIAISHHEKWDGSGYPYCLKGEAIPIEGRIIMIADVFDALTTERPYKLAWSLDDALEYIKANAGSFFDPSLVPIFVAHLPDVLDVMETYKEKHSDRIYQRLSMSAPSD